MKASLHWRKWIGIGLLSASLPVGAQSIGSAELADLFDGDNQYELLAGLHEDFNRENRIKPAAEAYLQLKVSRLRIDLARESEI